MTDHKEIEPGAGLGGGGVGPAGEPTREEADHNASEAAPPRPDIVVVLHQPQDLVNIAATARAMLNMGLNRLRLVNPPELDPYRIEGIAHGSAELIERIQVFSTLRDAVADAVHVVGTTARRRTARFVWQHPREAAPELLELATAGAGPVVLVFGPEDRGLTNEELDTCDRILTVPTDPRHSSLNLAQAVLLITYELWLASPASQQPLPVPKRASPPATAEDHALLFEDVQRTLETIEFFKTRNPDVLMRTLRALARRARLDVREAHLLRAIAIEARKYVERMTRPRDKE